jgi:hypothetical protein
MNAFDLAPNNFRLDQTKVSWAAQFLQGTPQAVWKEHRNSLGDKKLVTWDYFTQFLLDQIEDPVNRELDALQAYEDAKQQEG